MPEPTASVAATAAPSAVGAVIGGAGAGLAAGIPIPVILAAVVGAVIAVNRGERIELSVRGLWTTFLSFALALAFGVLGGPLCGFAIERWFEVWLKVPISGMGADALCALILSVLGQSVILPALAKRLGVEITSRGTQP